MSNDEIIEKLNEFSEIKIELPNGNSYTGKDFYYECIKVSTLKKGEQKHREKIFNLAGIYSLLFKENVTH